MTIAASPSAEHLIAFQDMPGPKSWPLVGHLPYVVRAGGLAGGISTHVHAFPEGIFRIQFPGINVATIWRARVAAEVFDVTAWDKDIGGPLTLLRPLIGDGLFTAASDEPNWQLAHRILMPAFTQAAMENYLPAMQEVLEALVEKWDRHASTGQPVDVRDDMMRLTLDTISLAGFGYRFRSFETAQLHPFLTAMGTVLRETMFKARVPSPVYSCMVARRARVRRAIETMNALVDTVIAERRAQGERSPNERPDLLQLMLSGRDELTGEQLSDENIRFQILTFLIAGHETTSSLLGFALREVAHRPPLRQQLSDEADEVLSRPISLQQVGQLGLSRRVLLEALRLWPPAPAFSLRPLREDCVVAGKYLMRKGTRVAVLLPALHRDPEVWSEPEKFDPDRFLPGPVAERPTAAYKPFGNGKRSCIGRRFALVEAQLALSTLVQRYDFELVEEASGMEEMLTLRPARYLARLTRRSTAGAATS